MFSTIDKLRSSTTTTLFQKTVITLSLHNQISTLTTISLQLLLHIKFYEQLVSLINKLQPLSYQSTSNITPLHFTHLNQPQNIQRYCTTHISLIHIKKLHVRLVQRRPNIRSHSVLFFNTTEAEKAF